MLASLSFLEAEGSKMGVVNYYHAHNINAQREWQLGWQRRVALSALMVMSTREYCWAFDCTCFGAILNLSLYSCFRNWMKLRDAESGKLLWQSNTDMSVCYYYYYIWSTSEWVRVYVQLIKIFLRIFSLKQLNPRYWAWRWELHKIVTSSLTPPTFSPPSTSKSTQVYS